jgi:hypothetical protein
MVAELVANRDLCVEGTGMKLFDADFGKLLPDSVEPKSHLPRERKKSSRRRKPKFGRAISQVALFQW